MRPMGSPCPHGALAGLALLGLLAPATAFADLGEAPRPAVAATAPAAAPAAPPAAAPEAPERDEYADSFLPLKPQVRDYERDPQNRYTYCIRSIAIYECLSYGSDGAIRRQRTRVAAHGTGFAYREQGGETFLLTNQHVAEWPSVTDAAHRVDDVAAGCKRVSDTLKIVDNENDDYGADDVPLTRVATDDSLDATVVKAKGKLRLLPYRIGRSAMLTAGDVVLVRGFPLGAFQAVNSGKVVNPYDHDEYRDWDHVDFIIDAPLSSGNSGSPVLAVSTRTGEYELVGMFHAGYTRATALNAVVGIDQLRDFMFTLKHSARGQGVAEQRSGPAERAVLEQKLAQPGFLPFLSLGPLPVALRRSGDLLLFEVFSRRFPTEDRRVLILGDRAVAGAFGSLAALWFGNERGLKAYDPVSLDGEVQAQLQGTLRRLHALAASTVRFRDLSERAASSRDLLAERAALQRVMTREASGDQDLAQVLLELAERLAPRPSDQALAYGAVLTELQPRPAATAPRPAAPPEAAAAAKPAQSKRPHRRPRP